ncbi:MAG: helicase-related protein [Phototrophicaceae bacterium]
MLDHTIFLSLEDFGKVLPSYEEIAIGVDLDPDVDEVYRETRDELKRYLMQHREAKSGKSSFMGAYLQWALGWQNVPFIETKIIHNQRGLDGKVRPHVVKALPTFDADRIYAKEQALIDLLKDELSAGRRCVVYLRQTQKNDLQPRLESLIRQHVPGAIPFVLRNTVNAEKREALIEKQLTAGMNVLICNPELVKTGLDLLLTPTLVFYEITLSLSTMMQAAARAYRLNQRDDCKTVYLFARGTFEQSAVQLMSRKQRAAKLLMGSAGVSGLDAVRRVAA